MTKFLLERKLPRKPRYAKVYLQAGPMSLLFSLDGRSADCHATIGRGETAQLTNAQHARLKSEFPAVEMLDNDGHEVPIPKCRRLRGTVGEATAGPREGAQAGRLRARADCRHCGEVGKSAPSRSEIALLPD